MTTDLFRVADWRALFRFVIGAAVMVASGCSSQILLMPTPTVYTDADWDPFADVPPALQSNEASVLYVTDRAVEEANPDLQRYGWRRSRSAAFGDAVVRFGDGLSWDQVVAESRSSHRSRVVPLTVGSIRERVRFDPTPPELVPSDEDLQAHRTAEVEGRQAEAERQFREALAARLTLTPRKEVFLYVHGFNNTFEDAVIATAEIWHFLGREGVPVCYTWPAGVGGLRAYEYTVASTEFTVYHLKQTLRLIASCPEVEKVHIIAHSRGTAVTINTVRELHLELRSTTNTREALKLGTVILAAADIDLDVLIARNATERIGRAVERVVLYISERDKALGLSSWLFGGRRLGRLDPELFDAEEIAALQSSMQLQFVDARVHHLGAFNHNYFHANPSVSSDLVLALRYQLWAGPEHGRPLGRSEAGFWLIGDGYPGADWTPPGRD